MTSCWIQFISKCSETTSSLSTSTEEALCCSIHSNFNLGLQPSQMNSGVSDKISCIQMRMDDPSCQGSAVLPLSLAALWVVLWLDTFFLWARLDGEANKSPSHLQPCWCLGASGGSSTGSRDAVPWQGTIAHPAAPLGPGAITGDGGPSESSVGTYSSPVDSQWKEAYILFNSSMLWGCLLLHEWKIWDSFIFFFLPWEKVCLYWHWYSI